jgi:hypothetical protein
MMHHATRHDTRDIYVSLPTGDASAASSGDGFDISAEPKFNPRIDDWKADTEPSTRDSSTSNSSWFKW